VRTAEAEVDSVAEVDSELIVGVSSAAMALPFKPNTKTKAIADDPFPKFSDLS
jgi:hypothetical protein